MKLMTGLKKKQICAAIAFGLMFTGGGHWEKAEATEVITLYGAEEGVSEEDEVTELTDPTLAVADNTATHIAVSTNDKSPKSVASNVAFTVKGGTWDNVYGGMGGEDKETLNNEITISGGAVSIVVVGGDAVSGGSLAVTNNTVNIGGSASVNGVYGGRNITSNSAVTSNIVNISGGTVSGSIFGGLAEEGSANKNQVLLNNDIWHTGNSIIGGRSYGADANGNSVTIEGGNFDPANDVDGINIYGGFGKNGASNNTVNISGGNYPDITYYLRGGSSESGKASNNVINISGGSITGYGLGTDTTNLSYGILGGYVGGGSEVSHNVVNISGGTLTNIKIWGAFSSEGVETNDNVVNISGGTFCAEGSGSSVDVYAARTNKGSNNTVNLIGEGGKLNVTRGVTKDGTPVKGYVSNTDTALTLRYISSGRRSDDSKSTSILNITGKDTTVANIAEFNARGDHIVPTVFSEINFVITSAMNDGDTMLTIKSDGDADTDFHGADVYVKAEAGANLQAGDVINLVNKKDAGALKLPTAGVTVWKSSVRASYAEAKKARLDDEGKLTDDTRFEENDLVLTVKESISIAENAELGANAKNMVETRAAGMAVVNEGMDFVTGQGMGQAKLAAKAATKEGSRALAPFASVGGGNMRYNSGSHVDSKSWHGTVGLAKEIGDLTVGLAINHGSSSYDSYNAGGVHGSGSSKSTGVTVMAEVSRENGVHYDAALQAGRLKNDYSANLSGYDTRYDESSNYYGLSLGGGKEFAISDKEKVDVYGRYYWSHTNSSDTTTNIGDRLSFDAVNSHRLRLGGRYTRTVNDMSRLYAGLAWQYEFNGDARAVINGQGAPSPSLKGHSAMLELGWKADVAKNLAIDLNVSGWTGKQRGVTGSLGLKWMF